MGQFLAIGLVTAIEVEKAEIDAAKLGIEQLQEIMQQELHYVPEIYVPHEHEGFYDFVLKDEILSTQLLPFLQTLYPLLYANEIYYGDILEKLETTDPSQWLRYAEGKPEEAFQIDKHGMWDSIEKDHSRIHIYYESLLLSMEGKIMMEVFGRQFKFLKYTMMQTFRQFSLAGALRIYITG